VERIIEKPYTRKVYIERIIEQVELARVPALSGARGVA
jgi:hypothetical protein